MAAGAKSGLPAVILVGLGACLAWADAPLTSWEQATDAAAKAEKEGRFQEAERLYGLAIRAVPASGVRDRRLASSYQSLARLLVRQGRSAEAEPLATWALSATEKDPGHTVHEVAACLTTLAEVYQAQ